MRRRTAQVLIGGELGNELDLSTRKIEMEETIAALEPFVTDARRARITHVLSHRLDSVTVVVDALHDPHNGAALVRTCDAFGVQTFHAIERSEPLAVAGTVSRGSQKWIDVVRHTNPDAAVSTLQAAGYELVATHPEGELVPEDLAKIPRVALLLGNEHQGIAAELRAACTRAVRVPMVGFVESLNVSVTAGILLYAATRGRPGDLSEARKRALYARGLWRTVPRPEEHLAEHRNRRK